MTLGLGDPLTCYWPGCGKSSTKVCSLDYGHFCFDHASAHEAREHPAEHARQPANERCPQGHIQES